MWKIIKNVFKAIVCFFTAFEFIFDTSNVNTLHIQLLGGVFFILAVSYFLDCIDIVMTKEIEKLKEKRKILIKKLYEKEEN